MGTRIKKELHGFEVSFAYREMNRRRVPICRASEPWISLEQSAQRDHVAFGCGDDCVPCGLSSIRFEFLRFDHRVTLLQLCAVTICPLVVEQAGRTEEIFRPSRTSM